MTVPFESFRQCSHVAPDSCRWCSGDAADEREARRVTTADRARVARENERVAPLVAAAWAMPIERIRALEAARPPALTLAEFVESVSPGYWERTATL